MRVYIGSSLEKFKISGEHADLQSLIRQLKLRQIDVQMVTASSEEANKEKFVTNKTANLLFPHFFSLIKLLFNNSIFLLIFVPLSISLLLTPLIYQLK